MARLFPGREKFFLLLGSKVVTFFPLESVPVGSAVDTGMVRRESLPLWPPDYILNEVSVY